MSLTSVETLLPVLTWANLMGISPWEFGQMNLPNRGKCEHVWYRMPWQRDYLSRDEVGQAIARAEAEFAAYCGFWPAPKYITAEKQPFPRSMRSGYANRDAFGDYKSIGVDYLYVERSGVLARTEIDLNAEVSLDDLDHDKTLDTFTVTVATDITNPAEIGVYVREEDRLGFPLDETWRIRPVRVTVANGEATIQGHIALVIDPQKQYGTNPERVDIGDAASFLDQLAVYRVYTDTTHTVEAPNQGHAIWYRAGCDDEACVEGAAPVCVGEKAGALGQVYIRYELCEEDFWPTHLEPDRVVLNYRAGYPTDDQGNMAFVMADVIAHLATTYLSENTCGCERSAKIVDYWRKTPASVGEEARPYTPLELTCPWGPSRGAVFAWSKIEQLAIGNAVRA